MKRDLVRLLLLLLLLLLAACRTRATPPYNVLFISLDTVRQDVLGCYGRRPRHAPDLSPSPALDQLAREGVRMVDAYASSSWTLPSHISMMTGQPPLMHGVETEAWALDPSAATMAEILRGHGYRTVGVYSAPYLEPHWGLGRGFERYYAAYGRDVGAASERALHIRTEVERAAAAADWERYDALKRQQTEVESELNRSSEKVITSEEVSAEVITHLKNFARDQQRWFVFAHFFDAHCDYAPPPPYDTRFDPDYRGSITGGGCLGDPRIGRPDPNSPGGLIRELGDRDLEHVVALYEGEVAWVDSHVAMILRALDSLALSQNTLVLVVSDHGEEFFEHGGLGHRRTLYEEVVRIPMLLRLPGVLPPGKAVRGPVSLDDMLPTVLAILGIPQPATPGSASFLPLIRGTADAASRMMLSRVVMMFGGEVQVDGVEPIAVRQIMVRDAFRQGPIKLTRTRRWPQFPTGLNPRLNDILQREAAAQYEREELYWVDVERFPGEAEDQHSSRFTEPAVRTVLEAFQREYGSLVTLRSRRHEASPLPENVRRNLDSLGYVDSTAGADFPEPAIVLPPPRAG